MIFPKILDAIKRLTKVIYFLIPLSITFSNPKILGFLCARKTEPNLGSRNYITNFITSIWKSQVILAI